MVVDSRVNDASVDAIALQGKEEYDRIVEDEGSIAGHTIWFKGHLGQVNASVEFEKLRDAIVLLNDDGNWFQIANYLMPLDFYYALNFVKTEGETIFKLSLDESSTILSSAFESRLMDSVETIYFTTEKNWNYNKGWYGEDQDILPTEKL